MFRVRDDFVTILCDYLKKKAALRERSLIWGDVLANYRNVLTKEGAAEGGARD